MRSPTVERNKTETETTSGQKSGPCRKGSRQWRFNRSSRSILLTTVIWKKLPNKKVKTCALRDDLKSFKVPYLLALFVQHSSLKRSMRKAVGVNISRGA